MILFEYETPEVIKRNAIGLKELVLSESVELGSDVVLAINKDERQLIIGNKPEDEEGTSSLFYLGTEFAPVRGVVNEMEIIIAGDYILLELHYGCLYIRDPRNPEKVILFFTEDCNPEDYYVSLEDVVWLNADRLRDTLKYYAKYGATYPEDYVYNITLELAGRDVNLKYNKKEVYDISMGALAVKEAKDKDREALKRKQAWDEAIYNTEEEEDDFTFESDEEDDDEEYNDALDDIF